MRCTCTPGARVWPAAYTNALRRASAFWNRESSTAEKATTATAAHATVTARTPRSRVTEDGRRAEPQAEAVVGRRERAEVRDGQLHLRPQAVGRDLGVADRPRARERSRALRIQQHDLRGTAVLDRRMQVTPGIHERPKPGGSNDHDIAPEGVALLQAPGRAAGQEAASRALMDHPGAARHPGEPPVGPVRPRVVEEEHE